MIVSAQRAPRIHRPSRSQQPGIVLGLRYERRFVKTLREAIRNRPEFKLEHNPWFFFRKSDGTTGACAPDVLLFDEGLGLVWVIEVKYTWVPDALEKLNTLYRPVIESALGYKTSPLVVAKRLTPDSPQPRFGFLIQDPSSSPVFQWLESSLILI